MKFGSGFVYKQKLEFRENWFNGSHILVRVSTFLGRLEWNSLQKSPLNITEQN